MAQSAAHWAVSTGHKSTGRTAASRSRVARDETIGNDRVREEIREGHPSTRSEEHNAVGQRETGKQTSVLEQRTSLHATTTDDRELRTVDALNGRGGFDRYTSQSGPPTGLVNAVCHENLVAGHRSIHGVLDVRGGGGPGKIRWRWIRTIKR